MFLMDLGEFAKSVAEDFLSSGEEYICVYGGDERERHEFCRVLRDCVGRNYFVFGDGFDRGGYRVDFFNLQEV